MWLEEPREERERSVCEPESLQEEEREDDGEYCEESWHRLKGRTIMSGETLVEKLDEAVCCRLCHLDVTFLENVNCKSCVWSDKEVYCYPPACICGRTFSLRSQAEDAAASSRVSTCFPFAFTFVFRILAN